MKVKWLSILCLILLQSGLSQASSKSKSIQKIFQYLADNNLFNGAALVVSNGHVVYHGAFGYANMEWMIPNTTDTRFNIGSVTKQFTAVLVLQLADEGKISLKDTISRYIPELDNKFSDQMTIHQLLTHTSGLPSHYSTMDDYMKVGMRIPYTFQERLEQLRNLEFEFKPGTSWAYSGFGYTILGHIVARVTGRSLEDNYKERIFRPLGMTQSGVMLDSRLVPRKAYGYQKKWDDSYMPAVYFSQTEAKLGGGGLYSTIEDFLKWYKAVQGGSFFTEQMKKKYFKAHYRFPDGDGYCYGHYSTKYKINENQNVDVFYHGGSLPGASALVLRVPEKDQCVVLFHNAGMGHEEFLYEIATEVLNILYGKEFHYPKMSILYSVGITALFDSIEEVRKHYYYLKNNLSDAYIFDPDQLNIMAMLLMQFGAIENIPGVLKLNIDEYPDRPSSYFELGKFYSDVDEKYDLALEYLNKALALSEGEMKKKIENKIEKVETRKDEKSEPKQGIHEP